MGKHYTNEFKQKVINDYNSQKHGGYKNIAKLYNLNPNTVYNWLRKDRIQGNQINDINHRRSRPKETNIDYKERYEILKKYQEFIKAQREKK